MLDACSLMDGFVYCLIGDGEKERLFGIVKATRARNATTIDDKAIAVGITEVNNSYAIIEWI